jgi:sugar (pentulose or hexulose) kinase
MQDRDKEVAGDQLHQDLLPIADPMQMLGEVVEELVADLEKEKCKPTERRAISISGQSAGIATVDKAPDP